MNNRHRGLQVPVVPNGSRRIRTLKLFQVKDFLWGDMNSGLVLRLARLMELSQNITGHDKVKNMVKSSGRILDSIFTLVDGNGSVKGASDLTSCPGRISPELSPSSMMDAKENVETGKGQWERGRGMDKSIEGVKKEGEEERKMERKGKNKNEEQLKE